MEKKQVEVFTYCNKLSNTKYHEFPELGVKTEPEPIETIEVLPFKIYTDLEATDIIPKWWHRLLFWRKYRYPRDVVKINRLSLKETKQRYGNKV